MYDLMLHFNFFFLHDHMYLLNFVDLNICYTDCLYKLQCGMYYMKLIKTNGCITYKVFCYLNDFPVFQSVPNTGEAVTKFGLIKGNCNTCK